MFPQKTRHALLVLWLGIAALALHALAGIAHGGFGAQAAGSSPGVLEICTAQGIVRVDAETLAPLPGQPAGAEHAADPHCCDLCGATCGVGLVAAASPGHYRLDAARALPAAPADILPRPSSEALTPVVPRGPPTRS